MTTTAMQLHREEEESRLRVLRLGMIAAIIVHAIFFITIPMQEKTFVIPAPSVPQVIELLEEVTVPAPPVEIPRPKIPTAAFETEPIPMSADMSMDAESIVDQKVSITPPQRLTPVLMSGTESVFKTWDTEPQPRKLFKPAYPDLARKAGVEGTVFAKVWIDEQGRVTKVVILESSAEIFEASVIEALKKSLFYPGEIRGTAIKTWLIVPYVFSLNN